MERIFMYFKLFIVFGFAFIDSPYIQQQIYNLFRNSRNFDITRKCNFAFCRSESKIWTMRRVCEKETRFVFMRYFTTQSPVAPCAVA